MKRLNSCLMTALALIAGAVGCSREPPEYEIVIPSKGEVRLPASLLDDGNAHFFTCKLEKRNINFFARTDVSGKLLTHFDACYSCYKYKLGYVQEEREMVCIACRIGFDLDQEEWDWVGPCVPVTLHSKLQDGELIIPVQKLEKGAKLF